MTPRVPAIVRVPPGPRLRLAVAAALGLIVFAVTPRANSDILRAVFAWDAAVGAFIGLLLAMMAQATPDHMRRRAAAQDQGRWAILFAVVAGAFFSMLALLILQKGIKAQGSAAAPYFLEIAATIILSWSLVHLTFALNYAHAYYGPASDANDEDGLVGGLEFPQEKQPDYWDFLYYAFVVGMTCQVSDVQVSGRAIRRVTLAHGIVSFFFNTIILALTINVIASSL
jgi:uncharacterized membrane protein